jgi:hypothetical protein
LIVFAYFFYIETKGYTIEEVSRLFDGGKQEADNLAARGRDDVVSIGEQEKEQVDMVDDRQKL